MFILLFMQNIEPIFKHRTIKPCCCLKLQRVTSKKFASAVPWEQKLAVQQTDICSACFPLKIELIKPMWGKWQHPFPGIGRLATLLTTSRAVTAPPPLSPSPRQALYLKFDSQARRWGDFRYTERSILICCVTTQRVPWHFEIFVPAGLSSAIQVGSKDPSKWLGE